jgi:hypothetical protein
MAMVFSNASQAMPPWGSRQMLLGTNPFCMAAPAGKHRPVILDMSPAVAARGKIRKAERRGEKIPLGYALDAQAARPPIQRQRWPAVWCCRSASTRAPACRCSWTFSAG